MLTISYYHIDGRAVQLGQMVEQEMGGKPLLHRAIGAPHPRTSTLSYSKNDWLIGRFSRDTHTVRDTVCAPGRHAKSPGVSDQYQDLGI